MRDEATALEGKHEVRGCLRVPAETARGRQQRIERAIDLDARQALTCELQFTAMRQIVGIEAAAPVRIAPAGSTDEEARQALPSPRRALRRRRFLHMRQIERTVDQPD